MPRRWIRVTPAAAMREGFDAVRREAQVPEAFSADADAESQRSAQLRGQSPQSRAGLSRTRIPAVSTPGGS